MKVCLIVKPLLSNLLRKISSIGRDVFFYKAIIILTIILKFADDIKLTLSALFVLSTFVMIDMNCVYAMRESPVMVSISPTPYHITR